MKSLSFIVLSVNLLQAAAQNATSSSAIATTTANSSFTTTLPLALSDFWNVYVGPVSTNSVNTTVSATPVPSAQLVPPPFLDYDSSMPPGRQVPLPQKNASWSFPKGFWWGVASAAYQVEGAVKDEGRGPSIWDVLTHRVEGYITNNDTGDIADNEYYLYKEDISRIAAMGVKAYSFSISWSRIFPFGNGPVNEQALAHYDDLIDTCIAYGVEPVVTLFHWDLPLNLQNSYGGWLGDQIVDDFTEYAKLVFTRYGNKVSKWFTVNEPLVFCSFYPLPDGYFTASTIPPKEQTYHCAHNVILSHAAAYRAGKAILANTTNANNNTISFKTNGGYKIPRTNSSADAEATQRGWDFAEGWYAEPIFLTGDYPKTLKDYVSTLGLNFTDEQKTAINGSGDLYAHDGYTSNFFFAPDSGIDACTSNSSNPLYPGCFNQSYTYTTGWNIGPAADPLSPWLHKATDWVPEFLHYIQDTWKPTGGIAVSEFGFGEPFEENKKILEDILWDPIRTSYYHDYMEAILIAMSEGVNVVGTLAWSIVDNLEWTSGYQVKFGIQYVNLTTQERHYKASFFEYVNAFKLYGQDEVTPNFGPSS